MISIDRQAHVYALSVLLFFLFFCFPLWQNLYAPVSSYRQDLFTLNRYYIIRLRYPTSTKPCTHIRVVVRWNECVRMTNREKREKNERNINVSSVMEYNSKIYANRIAFVLNFQFNLPLNKLFSGHICPKRWQIDVGMHLLILYYVRNCTIHMIHNIDYFT